MRKTCVTLSKNDSRKVSTVDTNVKTLSERMSFIEKTQNLSNRMMNYIAGVLVVLLVVLSITSMLIVESMSTIIGIMVQIDEVNTDVQRLVRMVVTDDNTSGAVSEIDRALNSIYEEEEIIHQYLFSHDYSVGCFEYMDLISESWIELKLMVDTVEETGEGDERVLELGELLYIRLGRLLSQNQEHYQLRTIQLNLTEFLILVDISILVVIWIIRLMKYISVMNKSDELYKIAYIDVATNIFNRSKCQQYFDGTYMMQTSSSLIVFDLNDLKGINDNLGHIFGDSLIRNFANILSQAGEGDEFKHTQSLTEETKPFVGRYGGDEFLVIFERSSKSLVTAYLQEVEELVEKFNQVNLEFDISYATGFAFAEDYGSSVTYKRLLDVADDRMYKNKKQIKALRGATYGGR